MQLRVIVSRNRFKEQIVCWVFSDFIFPLVCYFHDICWLFSIAACSRRVAAFAASRVASVVWTFCVAIAPSVSPQKIAMCC